MENNTLKLHADPINALGMIDNILARHIDISKKVSLVGDVIASYNSAVETLCSDDSMQ